MDQFNLFEPDLELGRSLIPYGDMEIQGVWPRKQRTPSDVFPTNAALIGRGPNNDARWCATDKDGILLTNPGSGDGGGLGFPPLTHTTNKTLGGVASTGNIDDMLVNATVKFIVYSISVAVNVDDTSGSLTTPVAVTFGIYQANRSIYALGSFWVTPTTYTGTKLPIYYYYNQKWDGGLDLSWYSFPGGAEFDIAFRSNDPNLKYTMAGQCTITDDDT